MAAWKAILLQALWLVSQAQAMLAHPPDAGGQVQAAQALQREPRVGAGTAEWQKKSVAVPVEARPASTGALAAP